MDDTDLRVTFHSAGALEKPIQARCMQQRKPNIPMFLMLKAGPGGVERREERGYTEKRKREDDRQEGRKRKRLKRKRRTAGPGGGLKDHNRQQPTTNTATV